MTTSLPTPDLPSREELLEALCSDTCPAAIRLDLARDIHAGLDVLSDSIGQCATLDLQPHQLWRTLEALNRRARLLVTLLEREGGAS